MENDSRDVEHVEESHDSFDLSALRSVLESTDAEGAWRTLYPEMLRMARSERRRWEGNWTLETRALANEAYVKLFKGEGFEVNDRAHFRRLVARAIRQVLIDYATARKAQKRGGGDDDVTLGDEHAGSEPDADEILELTAALERFRQVDPRGAEIVDLRFFGGLTNEEVAETLNISLATVGRDWKAARAWLKREIRSDPWQSY